MPDLPWLRLYTDTVDNEKLRLLAFEDRWHYIAILCLKQQGIINQNNQLMVRQIAVKLGLQLNDLDETKKRLMDVKLIDENYEPIGWKKHQYKSDSSTARVRKYRKSKKKLENKSNGNETLPKRTKTLPKRKSNALDTDTDTDTDTDKNIRAKPGRFAPPTLEEVKNYCQTRNNGVDPSMFIDFYQAKNWMIGKNKMKDWEAAVRTWERNHVDVKESYSGGI